MVSSNAIPMNYLNIPYRIFPLGDSAITVDFGNVIDEAVNNEVIGRFHQLKNYPLHGMIEMIPAYSSLTIRYDVCTVRKNTTIDITAFDWMKNKLDELLQLPMSAPQTSSRLLQIPVCYENGFAPDIKQLAAIKNLSQENIKYICLASCPASLIWVNWMKESPSPVRHNHKLLFRGVWALLGNKQAYTH